MKASVVLSIFKLFLYRQEVKEQIKEICPFVQEVIPIKVLKSDFVTYEQKKLLAQSYDFFVGDRSIFNVLPSILGSQFIKQRKLPIKIENWSYFTKPTLFLSKKYYK